MKFVFTTLALAAGIAAGIASANGSPYSPGLLYGWNGVGAGDGVRYVAFGMPKSTIVAAVRVRDGHVLRSKVIRGDFAVPLVAYDGTPGGLSGNGKSLVLGSYGPLPGQSERLASSSSTRGRCPYVARSCSMGPGRSTPSRRPPTCTSPSICERETSRSIAFAPTTRARVACAAPSSTASKARRRWAANPSQGVECRRPLGVHALRAPRRRAVRARPRHGEARGVLRRPAAAPRVRAAVGSDPRARVVAAPLRAPAVVAGSPLSTRAPGR